MRIREHGVFRVGGLALAGLAAAGLWGTPSLVRAEAAVLAELEAYFQSVDTMQGDFVQEVRDEAGVLLELSRGRFWIVRPDRFRWSYETPFPQEIVADGEALFIHDVDLDQITVRAQADALGSGPAVLLSGDLESLRSAFDLAVEGDWIVLSPRNDDWALSAMRLRFEGEVPATLTLVDGLGQSTLLDLQAVRLNADIGEQIFRFTIPDGVDVIDERNGQR